MAKGVAKASVGFNTYRRRESPTIQALKNDTPFTLEGTAFEAGDFIVRNEDNTLSGMSAEQFDSTFEIVRKTWSRKKKATGEDQPEGQTDASGEVAQSNASSEVAA